VEATESGLRRFLAKDGVELLFADGAPLCLHCGARGGYNPQRMEGTGGAPEFVERLRSELPRLLREDVEVRGQIIALLSDYLTTRQETAAILAELRQMRQDFDQRMDEQGRRIEEQGRRIEEHTRVLGAIGARWGMMTEEAFRRSVQALYADQPQLHVEHWRHYDAAGKVFGYPAEVDMDVVVRDGTLVLIEVKSSISGADVAEFGRRVALYREVSGREPSRLLMIGPYADPRAREAAERLGIELVSGVTPPAI
jgi:hypothetical protein